MKDITFDDCTKDHIIVQDANGEKTDYGFNPCTILEWEHFKDKYPDLAEDYLKARRTYETDASIVYKIKENY